MGLLADYITDERNVYSGQFMPLIAERIAAGQTVRNLSFQGISMLPMLRQGKDFVELTRPPERLKKYDLPLYRNAKGKYVMHRVVDVHEDYYVCLGDNTYHYEKIAPEQMIAIVCAFTRNGKRISVENRGYRAYCCIWYTIYPIRRFIKCIERHVKEIVKKAVKR